MEKEIVTKENIKQDILRRLYITIPVEILGIVGLQSMFIVYILALKDSVILKENIGSKVIGFLCVLSILWCLFGIIRAGLHIFAIFKIKKGNFKIKKSTVVKKLKERIGNRYVPGRPSTFVFAKNRKFYATPGKSYKWSERHCMGRKELYDKTDIYDIFYIVYVRKEILMVYNTKYFELEEAMK